MHTMDSLQEDTKTSSEDTNSNGNQRLYNHGGGGVSDTGTTDSENDLHTDLLDVLEYGKNDEFKSRGICKEHESTASLGTFDSPMLNNSLKNINNTDMGSHSSLSDVSLNSENRKTEFLNTKQANDKKYNRTMSQPTSERTPLTGSTEENENGAVGEYPGYRTIKKSHSVPSDCGNTNDTENQQNKDTLKKKFKTIASFANLTNWWKNNVDKKVNRKKEKIEERKMRVKLQYHFMTPFEKYKLGRKPWKLFIQILKILIVTTQVILFGADRFASVAFIKNTHISFRYIFLKDFNGNPEFSLYTRRQLVDNFYHINEAYHNITETPIGRYWYTSEPPPPVVLCEVIYKLENESMKVIDYHDSPVTVCQMVTKTSNFSEMLDDEDYFSRVVRIHLKFRLNGVYLNAVILGHKPECMSLNVTIHIDNSKHDGRLRTSLKIKEKLLQDCSDHNYTIQTDQNNGIRDILISFDVLVITICTLSLILCVRSVVKSVILAQAAEQYFEDYRHEKLTKWDLVELINKWFPVIALSDLLSITGSIYKIYVDKRGISYYNLTSVFLGVGVILVWVGLLRFFTYFKKYNTLLITLRAAAPSLVRFMFCAMFIFFGFTFCGWIVLGAYHEKFNTFLTTAECLYSLVNGDDMFPTFEKMPSRNVTIWVFSKIYLYIFISLFIYLVLSTFISIISDSYERLKDYGRLPPTRIERFISGRKVPKRKPHKHRSACARCVREKGLDRSINGGYADDPALSDDDFPPDGLLTKRTFTASQLSLVSASLE